MGYGGLNGALESHVGVVRRARGGVSEGRSKGGRVGHERSLEEGIREGGGLSVAVMGWKGAMGGGMGGGMRGRTGHGDGKEGWAGGEVKEWELQGRKGGTGKWLSALMAVFEGSGGGKCSGDVGETKQAVKEEERSGRMEGVGAV